jgi:subtilisin family serine protease
MSIRLRRSLFILISASFLFATDRVDGASSRVQLVPAGSSSGGARGAVIVQAPDRARAALLQRGFTVNNDGRVGAMVELAEPSAVEVFLAARKASVAASSTADATAAAARATALGRAQMTHLEQVQRDMVAELTSPSIGADVIYRVQRVYNGIAVEMDPAKLDDVRALPGVKAVHPLVPKTPVNSTSVPFIGAPQVWDLAGGTITGAGVKVGVIDTGIDYLHADFGGSGNYRSDGKYVDPNWPKTAKVVGGYDFAGDDYDASGVYGSTTPTPDPDPMDCWGSDAYGNQIVSHGTHVAGTLAGYGENADGSTFTGPWDGSTPISTLGIGPGVAPGAQLYALRVFGCEGSTSLVTAAIDWAVDPNNDGDFSDHLDVISMSLGSSYGTADDPDAAAADRAASLGVIVVAAAGNNYDGYFITSTPGSAGRAISVAACGDPGAVYADLEVNTPEAIAGPYAAQPAQFGPALSSTPITAALVRTSPSNACSSLSNKSAVSGNVAFINRGTCNFTVKVKNAQLAGAVAAVIADNVNEPFLITMIGDDSTITIPSVSVLFGDGVTFASKLPSPGINVTLTGLVTADTVASFSSRGPRTGDAALKPDVAAPGLKIFSADGGTANAGFFLSGTSMATPHVAGVMALLRQLHPTWSVEELKALAMNTGHDVTLYANATPPVVGPNRVGGGRVDAAAAAAAPAVAFNADDPGLVSVSFGALEVADTTTLTKHVTVENKSGASLTYAVAFSPIATVPGVAITFPQGSSVTVPAGGVATVDVQLTAEAAEMRHTMDPSVSTTSDTYPRFWQSEEDGYVTLTPDSGQTLRVPIYAALRPISTMTTVQSAMGLTGTQGTATLDLTGEGLNTGSAYPTDILSLVSAFELVEDNPDPATSDARYLGVTSDYPTQVASGKTLADSTIYFGIAMQDDWSNPVPVVYDIFIDSNGDGTDDYDLFITDYDTGDDVYVASVCPISGSTCSLTFANGVEPDVLDTAPLNSNVVVLPVAASDLGLKSGSSRFKFYFNRNGTQVHHSFDPAQPGLSFGGDFAVAGSGQPIFPDLPGEQIQVSYDQTSYSTDGASGILLLHHHNGAGNRAEVLPVEFGSCSVSADPVAPSTVTLGSGASFQANATATSCSGAATYDWDFGDGSAHSSDADATHQYAQAGSFTWRLLVSYGSFSVTKTGTITVTPRFARVRHHLSNG